MKAINEICRNGQTIMHQNITKSLPDESIDESILKYIFDILAPDFNETFVGCKLFDKWIDCETVLHSMLTDKGKCYAFNNLNIHEILTSE